MSEMKCTLSDAELLDAVKKFVSKLCDTGGSAWTLSVPVNVNRDPDILITELCSRYAALRSRVAGLEEALMKIAGGKTRTMLTLSRSDMQAIARRALEEE